MRLLLDGEPLPVGGDGAWVTLLTVAGWNGVLVRAAESLNRLGVAAPAFFAAAVAIERERVRANIEVIETISQRCALHGIAGVFPKALRDYPDMGRDLDLVILPRASAVDEVILADLGACFTPQGLDARIAGRTVYRIGGVAGPVDIHHGRLGALGEEATYPHVLVSRCRTATIGGRRLPVLPPEDALVLHGMQRVYARRGMELSDVVSTISSLRHDRLDWDYIVRTIRRLGAFAGLSCYLTYVDQIHAAVFGRQLVPDALRRALIQERWGRARFREGRYRFPTLRVNAGVYLHKLRCKLASGEWEGAGRLCLLPVVALAVTLRRVVRGVSGAREAQPHPGPAALAGGRLA